MICAPVTMINCFTNEPYPISLWSLLTSHIDFHTLCLRRCFKGVSMFNTIPHILQCFLFKYLKGKAPWSSRHPVGMTILEYIYCPLISNTGLPILQFLHGWGIILKDGMIYYSRRSKCWPQFWCMWSWDQGNSEVGRWQESNSFRFITWIF